MGWIVLFGFGQNEVAAADTLSPTESLVASRVVGLPESVSLTETLRRVASRNVADVPALTESLRRQITRRVAETAALSEQLTKSVSRLMTQVESLSFVEGLSSIKVAPVSLADTLGVTEQLVRTTNRRLLDAVSFLESVGRTISRRMDEALASGEDITDTPSVRLADTLGVTEQLAIIRVSLVGVADVLAQSEQLRVLMSRTLTEQLATVEQLVTQTIGGVIAAIPQRPVYRVHGTRPYRVAPRPVFLAHA